MKKARESLKRSERLVEERDEYVARVKGEFQVEHGKVTELMTRALSRRDEVKTELAIARGVIRELEQKNAELEEGKAAAAEFHRKEMARLRDSRVLEVTKERVRVQTEMAAKAGRCFGRILAREERRGPYDNARLLLSQAFKTKKGLEVLKEGGTDIPQATIEMFGDHK